VEQSCSLISWPRTQPCGGGLTLPSSGRPTSGFACCRSPLMSNVRRRKQEQQASRSLCSAVVAANASGASGNAPLQAKQVQRSLRVPVARHVLSNVRLFLEHVHALARAARPASWRAASLRIVRAGNPRQSSTCSWSTCSGTLRHMSQRQRPSPRPQAQGTGQSQAIQTPAPNPSIERTVNSQLRCLSPAAHVKR